MKGIYFKAAVLAGNDSFPIKKYHTNRKRF